MNRRELLASLAVALPVGSTKAASRTLQAAPAVLPVAGQERLAVWAYGGQVPGPVLRQRQGTLLDLELLNQLPDATTIHWHGLRLPNAMDGVPGLTQAPVAPGERFGYRFSLPDAGTFWYHPHLSAPEQLERGLAGVLIVEETQPPQTDAEAIWLLDDWRLDPNGRIAEDFLNFHDVSHAGRLGQQLTVNGQLGTKINLQTGQRLRLRLINAANARIFALALPGLSAWLIARDGMPTHTVQAWDDVLLLGPGMRADVMVDAQQAGDFVLVDRFGRSTHTLAQLHIRGASQSAVRPAPSALPPNPVPSPDLANAQRHRLVLGGGMMNRFGWPAEFASEREARRTRRQAGERLADPVWTLNGHAHMSHTASHHPEFSVSRGQSLHLTLENRTNWWHPMHLHGHHFQVLSRNGQLLGERPWRDTVLLTPNDTVEIAFVADNPGRWLIHCHVLEHHAGGLGTMFEVQA